MHSHNLSPKVLSVAFNGGADVLVTRYSTFADLMQLEVFEPFKNIGTTEFKPPAFRQSNLILYQGNVVGVCFGGYDMRFLDRPCMGVFATSPQKELAADFIAVVTEAEPLIFSSEGELKRIAESFFASLFYVEDYVSAFEFFYSDPARRTGEWTQEEFIDVMTNRWLYRRVDTVDVTVDVADVVMVNDWESPRDGLIYPEATELYALVQLSQDPEYVHFGWYFVRYLTHWVPDGDEWKVLSAPYNLFE